MWIEKDLKFCFSYNEFEVPRTYLYGDVEKILIFGLGRMKLRSKIDPGGMVY